jgi:D-xylose transport system permease protein
VSETSITQKQLENAEQAPDSGLAAAAREYVARVRGGDVGPLPAILGLVALLIVFSALRPSTFTNPFNFANLIVQSAAVIVIAMGLVFVLLLGEIDLAAGFTAGVCGAMLGITTTRWGLSWVVGVLVCLAVGALIGFINGALVSRVGIPSFVVTLAMFLALQGALLALIGEGGTIRITSPVILAIMANTLPPWLGWLLYVVVIAAFAFFTYRSMMVRRRKNLVAQSTSVWAVKVVSLALLLGLATAYLNVERSRNPAVSSIKGIPIIVVLLLVLLVALTFLLTRTAFGRHLYAIGGNAEAARRAGINVPMMRTMAFVLCSSIAAIAGIVLASRVNSVTPSTGGGETLLFAVGAAVIGGTSLFGGKGRPVDAIIGGLVVAVVANGMGLLNQSAAVVYIVTGFVLLLAAGVDALSRRRAAATGRG